MVFSLRIEKMDRVLLVMSLLCVNLLVHGAPLLESVGTGELL